MDQDVLNKFLSPLVEVVITEFEYTSIFLHFIEHLNWTNLTLKLNKINTVSKKFHIFNSSFLCSFFKIKIF